MMAGGTQVDVGGGVGSGAGSGSGSGTGSEAILCVPGSLPEQSPEQPPEVRSQQQVVEGSEAAREAEAEIARLRGLVKAQNQEAAQTQEHMLHLQKQLLDTNQDLKVHQSELQELRLKLQAGAVHETPEAAGNASPRQEPIVGMSESEVEREDEPSAAASMKALIQQLEA